MKKIAALLLSLIMVAALLCGCGTEDAPADTSDNGSSEAQADSDLAYVKKNGKLVVGVTDFAPMDYQENGKWIGFDADMATAFAKSLGVDVEIVEIDWDNKELELDGKSIDCVWNGMTLTDGVMAAMSCSNPYCNNAQIVIVPKNKADAIKSADDCKDFNFAVEAGSAGKDMAVANNFNFTEVDKQSTALLEVASGTSDAAIIDSLMAAAMVGEGTGYPDLAYTITLNSEQYGVGFRKGSDLTEKLNEFLKTSYADGSMIKIAEKYGTQAALIEPK